MVVFLQCDNFTEIVAEKVFEFTKVLVIFIVDIANA